MGRHVHKWAYALEHALPALGGWLRLLFRSPVWALQLLWIRSAFFFNRKLLRPVRTPDGFLLESGHQLISYWSLFIERECWARDWVDALAAETKPLILDVGANAGLFTHLLWTRRPDAEFIAFEPQPAMARKIAKWQAATGARLTLRQQGVSDHEGTANFFASEEGDPTASLKPEGPKSIKLTIPLVTLDSAIPSVPVFLMKVDVEGCECEVLAGGKNTINRARFLILEAHTPEALSRIQNELGPEWNSKRVGASDFLFSRS
ncbi:MAG TPA: FkbM family methyltransferase [Verrucomicrobiae bacterium]|nr:FkbM family methyltransferase [Verrucomicrobiae bacterium]